MTPTHCGGVKDGIEAIEADGGEGGEGDGEASCNYRTIRFVKHSVATIVITSTSTNRESSWRRRSKGGLSPQGQ